jgi:hypothetical protein
MATAPIVPIRPVRSLTGLPYPRQSVPETASVTFLMGALVVCTSGYLAECGADPALILGVASAAGHNGATDGLYKQTVYLAHPDTLFVANLDTSGGGGVGTGVTAATDRFLTYGVAKRSSSHWYVDKSDTTNKRVRIFDFWDEDAIGDVMGRVLFKFVGAASTLQGEGTT